MYFLIRWLRDVAGTHGMNQILQRYLTLDADQLDIRFSPWRSDSEERGRCQTSTELLDMRNEEDKLSTKHCKLVTSESGAQPWFLSLPKSNTRQI